MIKEVASAHDKLKVEIGLLTEITGYARNRRFRFDPYLRLFEDGGEMGEMCVGGPSHQSWAPMKILSDSLGRLERVGADVAE